MSPSGRGNNLPSTILNPGHLSSPLQQPYRKQGLSGGLRLLVWTLSQEAAWKAPHPPSCRTYSPRSSGRMEQWPGGTGWPEAEAGEENERGNRHEHEGKEKKKGGERELRFLL